MKLSRREREVLRALAKQTTWPARTTTGWIGAAAQQDWVPDTRKVLARLAGLGLVEDQSARHIAQVGGRVTMATGSRFQITDRGREVVA
ncbi:hypothetical protein SEA_TYPHA_99 [Mycobacterium phage Typha]|uniref:Uncharacterized protein n=1 Tax=Mycobacterium phage Typha TaxID=2517971 RepID=A0A482JAN3_9CAUD|nr:hypothetical protein KCH40_gp070 [Mycobacterium phage Typha]QBP29754.1 hypothetical protein SEA_TYPHA_99 [Mycobacterium phage Typha]